MNWQDEIEKFCEFYNIPLVYLADTLNEPKVIPMIRGKAFEFSVMLALQKVLPQNEFEIKKTPMNAQLGSHDQDVTVIHKPSGAMISVECKLAAKGRFRLHDKIGYEVRVKCMRSRTVGEAIAERMSKQLNIPKDVIMTHNDQYRPQDFDIVVTSLGNAFYDTNSSTGLFEWKPNKGGSDFLKKLSMGKPVTNWRDFAFFSLYAAPTSGLAIRPANKITCTREKCKNPEHCGFIPNYPSIWFSLDARTVYSPWVPINDWSTLFRFIATSKIKNLPQK
ncbi:MAG: restriction endonuclease [Chloroflexi bacterium]|nr:restriction endonuclease [Chloroflexota bacterium]MBP8056295.1 restriction endonuclease [Chloroflexota bacterium]